MRYKLESPAFCHANRILYFPVAMARANKKSLNQKVDAINNKSFENEYNKLSNELIESKHGLPTTRKDTDEITHRLDSLKKEIDKYKKDNS